MRKYVWWEDLDGNLHCPSCGNQVDCYYRGNIDMLDSYEPKFCPECGQELDWAETRPYGFKESH